MMARIAAGDSAPSFSLATPDGHSISLASALQKGPVVLAFFKITCPVCQFTFPFLERLNKAFGSNASVLAVSQDDARDTKDFLTEYSLSFPALLDEDGYAVSNAYGLANVPTVFLIDSNGKVLISSVGFVKADLEAISDLLAHQSHRSPMVLFHPGEVIPAYKPG